MFLIKYKVACDSYCSLCYTASAVPTFCCRPVVFLFTIFFLFFLFLRTERVRAAGHIRDFKKSFSFQNMRQSRVDFRSIPSDCPSVRFFFIIFSHFWRRRETGRTGFSRHWWHNTRNRWIDKDLVRTRHRR